MPGPKRRGETSVAALFRRHLRPRRTLGSESHRDDREHQQADRTGLVVSSLIEDLQKSTGRAADNTVDIGKGEHADYEEDERCAGS